MSNDTGVQNSIISISGIKGYGKSTFLRQTWGNEQNIALIDTLLEHSEWCPLCPFQEIDKQAEALASPPEGFKWSFLISPDYFDSEGQNLHFNSLCKGVYMGGDMTLLIEEADRWFPNIGTQWANKSGGHLVDYGRKRMVNIVWVTRNLPIVDVKLRSQTDLYVLFKQQEPRYLEQMRDRFTDEIVSQVDGLDFFEYLVVDRQKNWEKRKLEKP